MNLFELALLTFFLYLIVYSLINRVCKCIEHCATARSLGKVCGSIPKGMEKEIIEKLEAVSQKEA